MLKLKWRRGPIEESFRVQDYFRSGLDDAGNWNNFVTGRVVGDEWEENFRMNRETFTKLAEELKLLKMRENKPLYKRK